MPRKRKKIRTVKEAIPTKLERILSQVCNQGYVRFKGKWYRGFSPIGRKPNCNLCMFAGCDII